MKKTLITLLIITVIVLLVSSSFAVYAEETEEELKDGQVELTGTELPAAYHARLNFSYLQPAEGGIYLKLELSFDSDYLKNNLETANKAVDDFEEYYNNTRYKTTRKAEGIIAEISFNSPTDYYIASGASGNDKPEKDKSLYRYSWFFIDIETPINNPFKKSDMIKDVLNLLTNINSDKIQYVYTYSTRYKTITTDGEVIKENDTYVHTFYMDEDNAPQTFTFKQRTVNTAGWYVLALVGSLALALIISAFGIAKYAKKHK